MSSWIEKIIESTAEQESPERYHYWAAMCSIAATLKKNVFLDRYYYKLYPNLYVLLVGKSGIRKGPPINLQKSLMTEAKTTRIVAGRASIQAIIKEIGKAFSTEDGKMIKDASTFLVAGEAASFFVKDPDALTILTDLYDTHAHEPEWKNILKTSGTDTLNNPCLTFLWATNEDHFKEAIADKDVRGGFIARSLLIYEDKRRVINSLMRRPTKVPDKHELVKFLKEVDKLKGEFKMHPESVEMYDEWYNMISTMPHADTTGTIERMGDTVLKVAMILSVATDFSLCIRVEHMREAVDKCMDCLSGVKRVTMGSGKSETAEPTALVLKELLVRPGNKITRQALLSKYWGSFDAPVLDRIIETLINAGALEAERIGKNVVYTMNAEAVESYKKFRKEIN